MDISSSAINAISTQQVDSKTSHIELPSVEQRYTDWQDVAAFETSLNKPGHSEAINGSATNPERASMADDVLSKMQSLSTHAAEKGAELEQLITKATHSLNPMDIVKANRMMSEYYLENMMTAKLVGNASKAIERLTSLN